MKISFVIPCYRSENTIELVVNEIKAICEKQNDKFEYEIILVNDNSPDEVWEVIRKMALYNRNIIGISLAKNFGQHSALLAGYARCTGEYIVSLDDDGQTPLEAFPTLLKKLEEGYDVVYAYYEEIKRSFFRKFGTWMSNKMGEIMLGQPKNLKGSSFYIAREFVIKEMIKYNHPYPYLGGLVLRTTRNITSIPTIHRERLEGKSGYSFKKLLSVWVNGFTAFSVKPLEIGTYVGIVVASIGVLYALATIVRKVIGIDVLTGWSSTISIILIIGGIILIMLGIIGEYIGRIYICINNSPQYVIREVIDNLECDQINKNGLD